MRLRLFAFILVLFGCAQVNGDSLTTAWEKIDQGALVIDVRTPREYTQGHLARATLIPYHQIGDKIAVLAPDKDRAIVLYCRSGRRSSIAKQTLERMGYTNVFDAGGLRRLVSYRERNPAS